MTLLRPLPLIGLGSLAAFAFLYFSFSAIGKAQNLPGCKVVSDSQVLLQEGQVDPSQTVAFWQNSPISPPSYLTQTLPQSEINVLGISDGENKWIEIDLGRQQLTAHEGDQIAFQSLISSGLWNSTPVGEYRIWYKVRSTKMEGGSRLNGTYYYLPNVPYAMFFRGDFGIHGTYWHSNFGRPMSHGCVNAPTNIAEKLFYWTQPSLPAGKYAVRSSADNPGTRVIIHK
ncbi:hypothetical protein A2634_05370 [Candidatus Amesbacteria bacterium RIFCSPHIGHO2_01_FULL_48_32]|uniref:L,D-TPase catalytic domain-containing protein n=1 Tax=Candidatus Amesbacteria bacterium RIFCSPLOWO2_01_FULL_48_25 TaxID=1797259 RepID=A0A1F4ZD51_9BACT|nr:MAG: hypothetical protein A2634_05370 [Candidatus Amesbacteria bacterium RIFCSPHIGHO2_01_FULL_48_32]OGD04095.1 MAG: hypothetical protein A2989_01715 [Candidatus Amesbacteria bacterium RIFCSPLOWO2_01_FULL_48_25]HJZ05638.1 L,D-transpeptidase [Patescibacteria group bacterium]